MNIKPIGSDQTELHLQDYVILFSYETPVAYLHRGSGKYYRTSKKWSRTTSKHINQWLGGVSAEEVGQDNLDQLINDNKGE